MTKDRHLIRSSHGFTLLEMLVVLVIIGLLVGLVGHRLFGRVDESKVKTAKVQIKMIKGALYTLRLDIGRFPTAQEGMKLLYYPPTDARLREFWKGPYLDEDILRPMGNSLPIQYSRQKQAALCPLFTRCRQRTRRRGI
ncbi:type II secretion system major pseudopilin GspG [Desulfobacterales bacterium HSG2]|nr:type II secretion system major pseudopilin GspG [Desulfobacterales bacterium HSG2]